MRCLTIVVAAASMLLALGDAASAAVVVTVDKSAQRLSVEVDGAARYEWPVSTARWGYRTPNGSYRPQRLERQWYSRKYDGSPMPYSIFFNGGYAIHGSYEVSRLGRPASHGCIRLHPRNAATLFELVSQRARDTRIVVVGGEGPLVAARSGRTRYSNAGEDDTPAYSIGRTSSDVRWTIRSAEGRRRPGSFEEIFDSRRR